MFRSSRFSRTFGFGILGATASLGLLCLHPERSLAQSLGAINQPLAVAVDGNDNVFVASLDGPIVKFNQSGTPNENRVPNNVAIGGINPGGNVLGIAAGFNNSIFFTNNTNSYYGLYDNNLDTASFVPYDHFGFNYASHIRVDSGTGEVYVTDGIQGDVPHVVRVFNSDGTVNRIIGSATLGGGSGDGAFSSPSDLLFGASITGGKVLFVADTGNNRIEEFLDNGTTDTYLGQFGTFGTGVGQFSAPSALAFDALGNLYVGDSGNNRIEIFSSADSMNYSYVGQFGSAGSGAGQFNGLNGLAIDSQGTLYASDRYNNRVQTFSTASILASASAPEPASLTLTLGGITTALPLAGLRRRRRICRA